MAAGTCPCATTLPFTFSVTSMGPPILATSLDSTSTIHLARGQPGFGFELGALDFEEVELVAEVAVFHIAGDATGEAGEGVQHAIGIFRHIQIHCHDAAFLPSLGAADSGMRVMGPSNVHSVSAEAGASSGWNIAVDQRPPPMGRFLFFADSSRNRLLHLLKLPGVCSARSFAWLQSSSML